MQGDAFGGWGEVIGTCQMNGACTNSLYSLNTHTATSLFCSGLGLRVTE